MNKEQRLQRNKRIGELRDKGWSYHDIGLLLGLTGKMVEMIVDKFFPDKRGWIREKMELAKIDEKIKSLNK